MPDPTIRGPKVPLKWSTFTISGYVAEKDDIGHEVDTVRIEDENSQYVCEVTGLRRKKTRTLEVIPLAAATRPVEGDEFTYGTPALKITVESVKESFGKGAALKWTITGTHCPLINT